MSVYKPAKSPRFQFDFVWQGQRYYGPTGCSSRRDAERFEADFRRKVALGEQAKPTLTLEEACNTWQQMVGDHKASAKNTLYQLAYLIAGLGARKMLHDVSFRDLQDYAARRRAMVSDASVNREIQLMRRVTNFTKPRGYQIPEIEWSKLLAKEKQRRRELSETEQTALFDALPDNLKPIVEFAILSGQRKSEVVKLRWADLDLHRGLASITIKGDEPHVFPLSPRMLAIIKAQPKVCAQVFTYVCQRPAPRRKDRPARLKGDRYPFSKDGWSRHWKRALREAGIENYRFHDNRHTAATRNLRSTGNLKAVSKLLGHKNIQTTARYSHVQDEDVRAMLFATESRTIPEPETLAKLKVGE